MDTKLPYEAIAEIIYNNLYNNVDLSDPQYKGIVCDLANYFAADNPRFDRKKFLEACGLE